MVSRRKLEEEIARSKDPVLRKQLQELLDNRSQKWAGKKKRTKDFLNKVAEEAPSGLNVAVTLLILGFLGAIVMALILRLILWMVGYIPSFWSP